MKGRKRRTNLSGGRGHYYRERDIGLEAWLARLYSYLKRSADYKAIRGEDD